MFLRKKFIPSLCCGLLAVLLVGVVAHTLQAQQSAPPQPKYVGDPMLAMLRQASAEGNKRFERGWSTIRAGLGYKPLPITKPFNDVEIDSNWEQFLNDHQVYVNELVSPLNPQATTSEISSAKANHRFWVSRFLRPELLPPSSQWATQFWLAPNGDEVAVTSWKSNGFSIHAFNGRSLCIIVRPDDSREIFGHTLAQIQAIRKTGKDPTNWTDPLSLAYGEPTYVQQIYALMSLDSVKNRIIEGFAIEVDDPPESNLTTGTVFMQKGDPVSGISPLPRTFVRDIHYWTDGVTVVFVVDKLNKMMPPLGNRLPSQFVGGLDESDPRVFKRFGKNRFDAAKEFPRYEAELQKTEEAMPVDDAEAEAQ